MYVSVDLNELKQANDRLGHDAGDELLQGAAACLQRCLGAYGRLYRVGGDEFVAQIFADEQHMTAILADLDENMLAWRGSRGQRLAFSYGAAARREFPGQTVKELAQEADRRMYEAKETYYRHKGVDRRGQHTAYNALCASYTKILRVDLTEDNCTLIRMPEDEQTDEKGFSPCISRWLQEFGRSGQVHPDDLDEYLHRTRLETLRQEFAQGCSHWAVFYRRRWGDVYRQAMMEMIPAEDYEPQHQRLYLYVKDIERSGR